MFQAIARKTSYTLVSLAIASGIAASHSYASSVSTQPVIEWSHEYGQDQPLTLGRSVSPTSDGGYIVTGDIEEIRHGDTKANILKLNASGAVEWQQKIQHDFSEYTEAYKAIETKDGGFLVSGAVKNYNGGPNRAVFLAKLSAQGSVEWEKEFDNGPEEIGESVSQTLDGGFVVTGFTSSAAGESSAFVLKVSAQGQQSWVKKFRFGSNQYYNDILATPDGGSIAVGSIDAMFGSRDDDGAIITKLDANGAEEWSKKLVHQNSRRSAYSIISSGDGGYVIGSINYDSNVNYLNKIDGNGEVIWEKTYDPTPNRDLFNRVVRTDSGYALLGESVNGSYPNYERKYQVLKVDQSGEIVDNTVIGDPGLYNIGKGTVSPDGGFVLLGQLKTNDKYTTQLTKLAGADNPQGERILTGISFKDSNKKIAVGQKATAAVNARYSDGTESALTGPISFSSGDELTATVDSQGLITGVKAGSTTITAAYQGHTAQLQVEVQSGTGNPDPVEGTFYLDSDEYSLTAGTSLDTIAWFKDKDGKIHDVTKQAVFKSDNPAIVDYDKDGNINGLRAGITYITAEYQGQTYRAWVQVVRASVPQ